MQSYQLTADAVRKIAEDHRRLQHEVRNLRQLVTHRDVEATATWGRLLRTGFTTTNTANPSYPTTGNVFVVKFDKATFDETPGDEAVTYVDGDAYVIARTVDGCYVPEDSRIYVMRQQAEGGRRWWIDGHRRMFKVSPAETINADSYGTCDFYENGSATFQHEAWFNWMAGGVTSLAEGTEALAQWFPDEGKFVIIAAECQA